MMPYLFSKFFHLAGVISWLAGLLYLYRLFVYHSQERDSPERRSLLEVMELRLYRYITLPAMVVTWVAGLSLLHLNPTIVSGKWFHVKGLAIILLTGFTHYAGKLQKRLQSDPENIPSVRTLRIMNEVPTLLMLVILAMVIFRPWAA